MHNLPNNNETDIIRNIFNTSVKLNESRQLKEQQAKRGAPEPGDVYSEEGIWGGTKELGKMVGSMFDTSDDPSELSREQKNLDHIKKLTQDPRNMPNLLRTGQVERSIVNQPAPAPDKSGLTTRRYFVPAGVDPKTADPDQPIRVPADVAASEQAKLVNKNSESTTQAPQTSQAPQAQQSKPGLQLKPTSSYTTGASTETNAPLSTKLSPTSPTGAVSPDTKWQPTQSKPSQPKKSMDDVMKSVMDIINKPSTPNKSLGGLGDAFGMGTTDALRSRTDAAVNKFGSPAPAAKPVNKSLGGLGDAFGMGTTDALRSRTDAAVNKFAGSPSSKPAAPAAPAAKPAPVAAKPTSSQSPFEAPPEPDQQPRSKRLPVGPQTTSGRETGLGANQTAFQPTQSWEDVAKKHIPDQFKNMPLSRKNGKVYAGDVEMTAASQETSQYADNAPRRPISEVYYRRLASLFEETRDSLEDISAKRRERQVKVAGLEGQVNPHGFVDLAKGIRNVQAFSGMGGADMPKPRVEKKERNVGEKTVAKADQRKALMTIMSASQNDPDFKDRFTKEDALNPDSPLHKALVSKNSDLRDESQIMAKYHTPS